MDYFKSINAHVQGEMDLDAVCLPNQQPMLISLGGDTVTWRNIQNSHQESIQLPADNNFSRLCLHPSCKSFLLTGSQKQVYSYPLSCQSEQKPRLVYESMGYINDIKYSSTGRYIAIASEEPKVIVVDTFNNRNLKCRPGHKNKIYNAFFNRGEKFVVSIGEDLCVLIYEIFVDRDPQEVFRTQFTNSPILTAIKGSFYDHSDGYRVYIPGTKNLQTIEHVNNRWQLKNTNIGHSEAILIVQILNKHCLITSSEKDLCTWSIEKQQKLVVLENMSMCKIIPIAGTFVSHRNDGVLYVYDRPLYQGEDAQADHIDEESRIQFLEDENGEGANRDNIQLEYGEDNDDDDEQREHERKMKKKFAQRLVKVLPQSLLTRATDYFQDSRFLFMNLHGYIIQSRQTENDQFSISLELSSSSSSKQGQQRTLFRNKQVKYFDINNYIVCYASQSCYGLIMDKFTSWEKDWLNIQAIALSANWLAVASFQEIRFVDFYGNIIKCLCFDRPIIAMQAYQNLLAVVFHQSIPMYESQMLGMKIFNVGNASGLGELPDCHVPLSISDKDRACTLTWFGFSAEGMIFSQDSFGALRAYSLETNQWTPVVLEALPATRKAWIVGFEKGEALYWRTTQSEPEPTVRPRLNIKTSKIQMTTTLQQQSEQLKQLSNILFQRYFLDHQLCRYRLWNVHKQTRKQKHVNYNISKNILSLKQIEQEHKKLDTELLPIFNFLMKKQQVFKAVEFVKSYIRCNTVGRDVIEILDQCNHRGEAIELQLYYDQRDKELEYETMQMLAIKELKAKFEEVMRNKKQNPLNPKFKKQQQALPSYSFPSSQPSQSSSIMEDITHKSQQNSKIMSDDNSLEIENPFLKKKATSDRKQEIEEHIEKYGVKRKVQDKKKNNGKSMF